MNDICDQCHERGELIECAECEAHVCEDCCERIDSGEQVCLKCLDGDDNE